MLKEFQFLDKRDSLLIKRAIDFTEVPRKSGTDEAKFENMEEVEEGLLVFNEEGFHISTA